MCGIFGLIDTVGILNNDFIKKQFEKGKHRGPEHSQNLELGYGIKLGFHRLAINGLDNSSSQPIIINNIALICNGEIYNYKELYNQLNINPTTNSDCEVIIHLYNLFGIEKTLQLIDGVYSFILYDMNIVENFPNKIYVARDPLGVRPLYFLKFENKIKNEFIYGFASELKMLSNIHNFIKINYNSKLISDKPNLNIDNYNLSLSYFKPGTYSLFEKEYTILSSWKETKSFIPHFLLNCSFPNDFYLKNNFEWIMKGIQKHLYNSVKKRYLNCERPIACLLSGGLDSSLITALICQIHDEQNLNNPLKKQIETYSIGLENSEDLKYAKIVANYLNTRHTEIIITEKEMIDIIPDVIKDIESFDITTVRASIGNYLLGKYISNNSEAKVIFNGDGSDELCGGYLYMNKAPNSIEFDLECRRLLKDIHMFDVLRSDKCISSHGLEPRTPFLDKNFVQFYLSISSNIRNNKKMEKYLLRQSFSKQYYNREILPEEILWRRKEAFSDGVTKINRSLFTIIQEFTCNKFSIYDKKISEELYYKEIFTNLYPSLNMEEIIPYFWMPKYIESNDPSARTLSIY